MQRISLRSFLITLLVILIIMVVILLYLYYILSRPLGATTYQTKEMKHLFSIYGYGAKEEEMLYRPTDVAFDEDGNIYIADSGRARILVFNSSGRFVRKIGKKGTGKGQIMEPVGVTVSKDGRVYVADKALSKVVIFSARGSLYNEFKVMVPFKPHIVNNRLYLTSYGHVEIYTLKGQPISKWGKKGRRPGDLDSPMGITTGKDGKVYVADTLNLRVQAFSKTGKILWIKGRPANDIKATDREFGLPCGITMNKQGLLFLVDAFHNSIKVLDTKGKQIATLGKRGVKEGELNLPAGIAFDQRGVFAIADKFNDRVQVVKITID